MTSKEWLDKEIERAYSCIADVISCDKDGVIKLLRPLSDLAWLIAVNSTESSPVEPGDTAANRTGHLY